MNPELFILLVTFLLLVAGILGVGYLFFRREIVAMLLARRLGPDMDDFVCGRCGLCCTFTVITDRKTVSALEAASGQPKETFSTPFLYFWALLKKGADGACVFRVRDPAQPERFACSAYEARPHACRQFPRVTFLGCIPGVDARCPQVNAMRSGDRTRAESLSNLEEEGT